MTLRAVISSCVGGGPMERLAARLRDRGVAAEVLAGQSPEGWRALMGAGRLGRVRARLGAYLAFPARAVAKAALGEPAVLVPTTNPFILPVALVATRALHGRPVVALVYDLYPDALEAGGVAAEAGLASRLASAANRYLFAQADAVVFIGDRMAEHARARYGEPRRVEILETGADAAELDPAALRTAPESDLERWCEGRYVLSYVGNLGHVHDWETLRDAVPRLVARPSRRPVGVVIAATGPGVEVLRRAWKDLPPGAVRFEPPLEDRAWARLLARSDVSLVTLKDEARRTCIPSKAFSALAAGSALLCVAPADSDLADLVRDHGVGRVVAPGDVPGLVRAAEDLAPDTLDGRRARDSARRVAVERFDVGRLAARWEGLLSEVAAAQPSIDYVKRLVDVLGSAVGLALTAPLMLTAAAALRLTMGSPVLFRQDRPGRDGKPFKLVKFRTMRAPRPGEDGPESDGARLTRVGKLLRATSIDELPTLLNVLAGDMSLVGPRPLLMRYLDRYTPEQARRQEVKPGITGWAQINGRNQLGWEEKFALDVWYVDHRSLALDLRILAMTVLKVLRREGISQKEHATMPEFMGAAPAVPAPARAETG